MLENRDRSSLPTALERVALTLRTTGWIAFWLQLVLAVISGAILLVFTIFRNNANSQSVQGIGFGIFFAICGLVTLGVGIYFAYRYTRIARDLLEGEPSTKPSKADTLQTIRLGLIVNLVGMLFPILGAQAVIGIIVGTSLSQPTGAAVLSNNNQYVQSLDLFVVQANVNTITAHFVGIAASIWLFNRVSR
ncbi:MAG TPA: hypothetical protein DEP38_23305 [Cyanobacteria bacterium UBA9226]|nr:hypothetical protein [Cyanobacteria bacterium UBA9226]